MKKILFIVSDDYGELVMIRLIALGLSMKVHVALPDRLYKHFDIPDIEKYNYKSNNDIKEYLKNVNPELVLLFSGYLLVSNGMIKMDEFHDLINTIKRNNTLIATSDPCLRVYDLNPQYECEVDEGDDRVYIRNALKRQSILLKECSHVYCVPFISTSVDTFFCCNDNKMYDNAFSSSERCWTFVLSKQDYLLQKKIHGEGFNVLLGQRISAIINKNEVMVNLLMPVKCLDALRKLLPKSNKINFIEFCQFSEFEKIISQSEMAFYWNIFSVSIFICRLYDVPTFFLHDGHMVNLFDELYEHGKKYWYGSSDPVYLDIFAPFEANIVSYVNLYDQRKDMMVQDNICASYSPDQMMNQLIINGSEHA